MSAFAHRSNEAPAHEYEWLDFSDRVELSAASIWALDDDDETTIQTKRPAKSSEHVPAASSSESGQTEIGSQVRILDESQTLPREASFATVVSNHETQLADFMAPELVVEIRSAESRAPTVSRPRILDESSVLPGEASFATVVLNREIQPDVFEARQQVVQTGFEQSLEPKSDSRKRILDESDVLPVEASFATVLKHEQNVTRSYSPLEEFHAKFRLTWKNLTMAAVVLFALSAGVTLAVLKIAESVRSRPTVVTAQRVSAPRTELVRQTPATSYDSPRPIAASPEQKQVTPPVTAAPVVAPQPEKSREEISSNRLPNATVVENSRKITPEADNKKISSKVSRQEAKARSEVRGAPATIASKRTVTEKPRQKEVVKDRVDRKRPLKNQVKVVKAPAAVTRNQSPSPVRESAMRPAGEPRSTSSGSGAQRPRTVTRKDP
jgi:hypothetical protein